MSNLEIIPLEIQQVEKYVESIQYNSPGITSKLSEILLATMDILYRLYNNLKSSPQSPATFSIDRGREEVINKKM